VLKHPSHKQRATMPPASAMALAWPSHPPYQASSIAIESAITSPWQRRGAHRQPRHKVSPIRERTLWRHPRAAQAGARR
jgi:hypothetical protein